MRSIHWYKGANPWYTRPSPWYTSPSPRYISPSPWYTVTAYVYILFCFNFRWVGYVQPYAFICRRRIERKNHGFRKKKLCLDCSRLLKLICSNFNAIKSVIFEEFHRNHSEVFCACRKIGCNLEEQGQGGSLFRPIACFWVIVRCWTISSYNNMRYIPLSYRTIFFVLISIL